MFSSSALPRRPAMVIFCSMSRAAPSCSGSMLNMAAPAFRAPASTCESAPVTALAWARASALARVAL
ncbi:hypothetical protein D9M71_764160 [compost metagenome]